MSGVNDLPASVSALEPFVVLLAVAGGVAVGVRLARSLLRLGVTAAEETAAVGLVELSARRGDLTGMAEQSALARTLRRARFRELGFLGLWTTLLLVPLAMGWMPGGYAASSVLWLFPRKPIRPPRLPPRDDGER